MALLTDLPAAANIGTSDYILIDTGSENKKLQISSFYADASHPGLVSTGAQEFEGYKTFLKNPTIKASNDYPELNFTAESGTYLVGRVTANHHSTKGNRIYFQEIDSSGSYRDGYMLPYKEPNDTVGHDYDILTTKSVTLDATGKNNALDNLGIHKATISAAKTITIPNSYRGLLIITNTNANDNGMYIITTAGTGAFVTKTISAASNITIDTSTANSLKLTPSSGTRTICLFDINGASTGW